MKYLKTFENINKKGFWKGFNNKDEQFFDVDDFVRFKKSILKKAIDPKTIYKVDSVDFSHWDGYTYSLYEYPFPPDGLGIGWHKQSEIEEISDLEKQTIKYNL